MVEGGRKTLQSFIDAGLWDEIRVETNLALTVSDGTRAPQIPANVRVLGKQQFGDNVIVTYHRS